MNDEIHPELDGIMSAAEIEIEAEMSAVMCKNYREIEEKLFVMRGDPDTTGEVYTMHLLADNTEATNEYIDNNPSYVIERPDGGESTGLLGLDLVGTGGNLYDGLSDVKAAVIIDQDESVHGVVARVGAWVSDMKDGLMPRDSPNKADGIITAFISNAGLVVVCRNFATLEVTTEYMSMRTYKSGEHKLVDALVVFWYGPRKMKAEYPEMYESMLLHIIREEDNE